MMSAASGHAVDKKIPTDSTAAEKSKFRCSTGTPRTILARNATGAQLTARFALVLLSAVAACTERFEIEDGVALDTTSTAGHGATGHGTTTDAAEPSTTETNASDVDTEGEAEEEELCTNTYVRTHGHQESYLYVPGYSPSAVPLRLADTDFTIEFWTKFENTEQGGMSLSVREPSEGWSFVIQPNYITGVMAGRFVHQFAMETADGEWHHVAWSYNHSYSRLFVDGVLVSTQAEQSLMIPVDAMFRGGVSAISDTAYEGAIDDVRISHIARYAEGFEVQPLSHDAASVVVWPFDEGEGDFSDGDGTYGVNLVGVEWMREEHPCD